MPDAATVVAVHGAWSGSWTWWKVDPLLEERGVPFIAVDLPTCSADDTSVDVRDDVRHVTDVVDRIGGPVVLVGNSYGGAVISGVMHPGVARLVYLAAFLPAENEPLLPLMSANATADFGTAVEILPDGRMHLDPDVEIRCAFQQASPEDHAILLDKTNHAMSFGSDFNIKFDRVSWSDVPSTYCVCLEDRSLQPAAQQEWARDRAKESIEWPFDHCPQVSHPDEVSDLLVRLAHDAAH